MRFRFPCAVVLIVSALSSGCGGDGDIALFVDLKTDLAPGVEFVTVRAQLFDAADRTNELARREMDVAVGRDLTTGRRIAEFEGLAPGAYFVTVTVVDDAGGALMARSVVIAATENTGVTVLMTRSCLGVSCPATGGDPVETACLGGRCVDTRCTPEMPEFCPAGECSAATDCTDMVSACAEPVCEDLTCFVRVDSTVCGAAEYCDPVAGCAPVEAPGDGGVGDAGDATVGLPPWAQDAYIKASNTDANDVFGRSVALSADGNTLAVGAHYEASAATGIGGDQTDDSTRQAGAVYVFARSGGPWAQEAYIKASNTDGGDRFGEAVALSADGNTLAVGASLESSTATGVGGDETDNSAPLAGAAYVFARSGGSWAEEAYVKASNTDRGDFFGSSVALSADGNTLVVAAYYEASAAIGVGGDETDNSAMRAGAVYVFARSGGSWAQEAYIKASNTDAGDDFGRSVSLSADGNTLAVGAFREGSAATGVGGDQTDNSAWQAGAAYVFARSGGSWAQEAYIKASNTGRDRRFCSSVALSADGDTLVVGAYYEASAATGVGGDETDDSAPLAGAVYVFARSGGSWAQEAYIKASNTDSGDTFGSSVALSADGNTLAVAAWDGSAATGVGGDQTDDSARLAGAVYVFARSGGSWAQEAYVKASNTDADDYFGRSVALNADGNTLAVGAGGESSAATGVGGDQTDNSAWSAGAVYVLSR